jgi:hypothetical protein
LEFYPYFIPAIEGAVMNAAIALLQRYNFDLGNQCLEDLLSYWREYDPNWVKMAVIECLYRGRYKAVSVSQVLQGWLRRQQPYCQFNSEFERLICQESRQETLKCPPDLKSPDFISHPVQAIDSSALTAKLKSLCESNL